MTDGMMQNQKEVPDQARRIANEVINPSEPRTCPPDCVERILTMRDRNWIGGAALEYIKKSGKGKGPNHNRCRLVLTLLKFTETQEFFAVAKDDLEDRIDEWNGKRNRYRLWNRVFSGAVSLDDAKRADPLFEFDKEKKPERPPSSPPTYTPEEKTGLRDRFFIPKKLDDWICQVLKETDWDSQGMSEVLNEGVVEVLQVYDIVKEGEA